MSAYTQSLAIVTLIACTTAWAVESNPVNTSTPGTTTSSDVETVNNVPSNAYKCLKADGRDVCGWHFYADPKTEAKPATKVVPARPQLPTKLQEAEIFNKKLKDALTVAVYAPTPENVQAWAELRNTLVTKAGTMADVHQRLMWQNPELDFSVTGRPITQAGMATFDSQRRELRRAAAKQLANTHVLYYFASSTCPYCKAFSPVLSAFVNSFGLTVITISTDGGQIDQFPDARPDNGISQTLSVRAVPALFIANPTTAKITPLGYGAMSEDDLFTRIESLLSQDSQSSLGQAGVTPISQPIPTNRSNLSSHANRAALSTAAR